MAATLEPIHKTPAGSTEAKLCVNCMAPNETEAHFCAECGAPISSYAATGPFEHIFAEGHVYRQAAEKPRSLIVVMGIWVLFGWAAIGGAAMLFMGRRENDIVFFSMGAFLLPISLVMIWRTTRSYLKRPRLERALEE